MFALPILQGETNRCNLSSSNEVTEGGIPILIRIDNGWSIDHGGRYGELFKTPLPWFKDLRDTILRSDVRKLIEETSVRTEGGLFQLLEPFFATGLRGFFGWRKVVVTRHRFHLFLRWWGQKGEIESVGPLEKFRAAG
jgi:hypothetical protein